MGCGESLPFIKAFTHASTHTKTTTTTIKHTSNVAQQSFKKEAHDKDGENQRIFIWKKKLQRRREFIIIPARTKNSIRIEQAKNTHTCVFIIDYFPDNWLFRSHNVILSASAS